MFIPEEDREGKKEALKKLMDKMGFEMGRRMGDMKKPVAASMTIEKMPDDEDEDEGPMDEMSDDHMEGDEDEEPSEADKAKIAELYHKYC